MPEDNGPQYPDAGRNAPPGVRKEIDNYMALPPEERADRPLLYHLLGSGTPAYKMSPLDAAYVDTSPTPKQNCNNCEFVYRSVRGNHICSQISGDVKLPGWCRLWKPSPEGAAMDPVLADQSPCGAMARGLGTPIDQIQEAPGAVRIKITQVKRACDQAALEKISNMEPTFPENFFVPMHFEHEGEKVANLVVEVTNSYRAICQGLMHKESLPENYGMLFKQAKAFWMKDVNFDLDMAYLDKYGTVQEIQHMEKATPGILPPSYAPSSAEVKIALEVPSGWCQRYGVRPGSQLKTSTP